MKSYFTDGNLFVRVGILVLFFGVAFLLKYAAEHSNIPVEVRYIAAAMGGLFLLAAGWRLRTKNSRYAYCFRVRVLELSLLPSSPPIGSRG